MSLDYNYLDAYIKKAYMPKMVDNILESNPILFRLLGKAKKKRGGRKISIPTWYKKDTNQGSYGRWDQASFTFQDKKTLAEFDWKYNRQFIILDRIDELENAGEGKIVDILDTEVNSCKQSFKDDLGTQFFSDGTGNNSKDIHGLKAAIDDGTNVAAFGGITRSTNTWWKAQYDANSGTDRELTVALMQGMWGECKNGVDTSDVPTLIVTTQAIFDKYAGILDPTRVRGDGEMGKAGFQTLLFNGVPLVVDSHCQAKHMYFVNERHVFAIVHPDENFKYIPFAWKLDQEVMVAKIRIACNLVSDECRKSGVILDIKED